MAYTELSSSLMKLSAEMALKKNTDASTAASTDAQTARSIISRKNKLSDVLGTALGGLGGRQPKPKKKKVVRQAPQTAAIHQEKPNPFKRRETQPVHMWTTSASAPPPPQSTSASAPPPPQSTLTAATSSTQKKDKTWAEIEHEAEYGFGARSCPNCFSPRVSSVFGATGHRATGMSTAKAEIWGRKDEGGSIVVMRCEECGLRFEEDSG
ncbi:hypothetical protein TrCOL_g13027 [Triparma columacea]|uniref:Uncharacterized protein n=1 Tax=Triparma columacea TaxID=722753 RepID=A0A9W7L5U9_9STRA|nr:hypothetical protein TrCOL_g13027 [Triparma columacea]